MERVINMVYIKEIGMRSFSDTRPYTLTLKLDKKVSNKLIKQTVESVCDVWVKYIKDVEEFAEPKGRVSESNVRNCTVAFRYEVQGKVCLFPKRFLPKVYNRYDVRDILSRFKKIIGTELEISSFIESL